MTNSNQTSTRPSRPQGLNIWSVVIAILSFLGFADASYLTAEHYLSLPLPCMLNGCEVVLTSKYATLGPIPTALFGVLYYLSILFLTIYIITSDKARRGVLWAILCITTIGLITSGFLAYLQVSVIHSLCMYCLGSALITLLLFASSVLLARAPRTAPEVPGA